MTLRWRNLVQPISTAEVSAGTRSQRFRHPTKNIVVAGVHVGFVCYGDPAFTALGMQIRADRSSSPGKLLASSTNTFSKAQVLLAEDHGMKFAGFSFDNIQLQAGEWYHLLLVPTSYTGNDSSFLGWRYSYPDPQYQISPTEDAANALTCHLEFSLLGYKLGASE